MMGIASLGTFFRAHAPALCVSDYAPCIAASRLRAYRGSTYVRASRCFVEMGKNSMTMNVSDSELKFEVIEVQKKTYNDNFDIEALVDPSRPADGFY